MVDVLVIVLPVVLGSLAVISTAVLVYCCCCGGWLHRRRLGLFHQHQSRHQGSVVDSKPPHVVIASNGRIATVSAGSALMSAPRPVALAHPPSFSNNLNSSGFSNWGGDDDVDDFKTSSHNVSHQLQHSGSVFDDAAEWQASTLPNANQQTPVLVLGGSSPDLYKYSSWDYNPYYYDYSNSQSSKPPHRHHHNYNNYHHQYNSDGNAAIITSHRAHQQHSSLTVIEHPTYTVGPGDVELKLEEQQIDDDYNDNQVNNDSGHFSTHTGANASRQQPAIAPPNSVSPALASLSDDFGDAGWPNSNNNSREQPQPLTESALEDDDASVI